MITMSSASITKEPPGRSLIAAVQETLHFLEPLKDKTFVVKLGGSTLENQRAVLQDLIHLHTLGARIVLVHGGGPYITDWLHRLGIATRFEQGMRVTDKQTLEVARMVLCGEINAQLVSMMSYMGGRAVGLNGMDNNMLRSHIIDQHLGLVGDIDAVETTLLHELIENGYIPVIAPLGVASDGTCLNINADLVASHIAGALAADRLIFLSDVDGIHLADGTRIVELHEEEAQKLIEEGVIHGGMIPKVTACLSALSRVSRVHIVDGCVSHVLLYELQEKPGVGTFVVR